VGYLHLKKAADEVMGMVTTMDNDGTPAGVDTVLNATIMMDYGIRRIKDVRQRLYIIVAIMPPRFVCQIEQGCHRALKAKVQSERMEQWKCLNYETALTKQTFEALHRCFPRNAPGVEPERDRGVVCGAIAHATDCGIPAVSRSSRPINRACGPTAHARACGNEWNGIQLVFVC
jgi:hypothetical protein